VSFELVQVPVAEEANLRPEYLAINPKGRVPALMIPGELHALTELPAIMTLVSRRHSQGGMLPRDSLDEARCHEWLAWLVGWVHGVGFGALWRPARFVADEKLHASVSAQGRQTIETAFSEIERRLAGGHSYALPCGFTIVDPFLLVLYRWGTRVGLTMDHKYPAWTGLMRRVLERTAVQRALNSEGISVML
jgi:glutathione S-transferase